MAGELGNTLWNDIEYATYVDTANKKAYQEALGRAKSNFKKHNEEIYEGLNPAEAISTWVINGLLAGEGDEDKYLKKHGFTQDIKDAGESGLLDRETLSDYTNQVERGLTSDMEKGIGAVKGGILGDIPLVGNIVQGITEPLAQTAGAAQALNAGVNSGNWDRWNKRDNISDLAALGQSIVAPLELIIPNSTVATGATIGGLGSLLGGLRESGENTDIGDLLGQTATGAAIGGAIPIGSKVAGKIGNAISKRGTNYLANQALASGLAQDAGTAAKIAQNTGKLTKARAAFSSLPKWGKAGLVGGTVAGGVALNNLLNSRNADTQTGYNDNAVYGSDNYGTTQGYNYGTYGY